MFRKCIKKFIATSSATTTGVWNQNTAAGMLATGSQVWSATLTGNARTGTVRSEAQRRTSSTGAWSVIVSASSSW